MNTSLPIHLVGLYFAASSLLAVDQNTNQQSDMLEIQYGELNLPALQDTDHDGWSNALESAAGTNPIDASSFPHTSLIAGPTGDVLVSWLSEAGKSYTIHGSPDLNPANFVPIGSVIGDGGAMLESLATNGQSSWFFKLAADDTDSDADGLSDWEEIKIGFNPFLNHTDRNDTADTARVLSELNINSVITVGLIDGDMREDWPDKGVIAIRRSVGHKPLMINITFTGSATRNTDYTTSNAGSQVLMPFGSSEAWLELSPVNDTDAEGIENIVVTVTVGSGYTFGNVTSATATLGDASPLPCAKEAARFLIQASFGPDQDDNDPDIIPENVEALMAMGLEAWIDDQFTRPIGYLQPYVNWAVQYANGLALYGNYKEHAWRKRAMSVPKLGPDDIPTRTPRLYSRSGFRACVPCKETNASPTRPPLVVKSRIRSSTMACTASFCCFECGPFGHSDHAMTQTSSYSPSTSQRRITAMYDDRP